MVRIPIEWRNNLCVPWRNDFYIPRLAIDINLNSNGCTRCVRGESSTKGSPDGVRSPPPPLRSSAPIYYFPRSRPRENRVEMALNYTDPIEFTTLPSGATCTNATTVFFDEHSLYSSFPCFFPFRIPIVFILWFERKKEDPNFGNGSRSFSWKIKDWKLKNDFLLFLLLFFVILPSLMYYWKFL